MDLKQALRASAGMARDAAQQLARQTEIEALGLEVLGVSIMAVKPTPDIARALEAEARESNLKAADDAVYLRRMSAVEKERAVRQNELDTDIAVEHKKRQIQETKMEARAAAMRKENELRTEQTTADVELEAQRRQLVEGQAENSRTLAEAEAHRVASGAFGTVSSVNLELLAGLARTTRASPSVKQDLTVMNRAAIHQRKFESELPARLH